MSNIAKIIPSGLMGNSPKLETHTLCNGILQTETKPYKDQVFYHHVDSCQNEWEPQDDHLLKKERSNEQSVYCKVEGTQ